MTYSRKHQAEIARSILSVESACDDNQEIIEKLSEISSIVLKLSGFDDNGIAFDLSEYLYEKTQRIRNKTPSDGWEESALKSLKTQLDDVE